jgi:arabinofuranosyltransferase
VIAAVTRRRTLQGAVFAIPLGIAIATGWAHRFIAEDGFIYLRVVQQIRAGNGPVFNAGERVEAFTSPLWLGLLTVVDLATPFRLEWIAVVFGLALSTGGLAAAMLGARALVRSTGDTGFLLPFGALVFVVLVPVWAFHTSGLETGATFAWLGVCLWVLANWARSSVSLPLWQAPVIGSGWLVRPELMLMSILFVGVVLVFDWRAVTWSRRLLFVACAFGLVVAYEVFRMGYYGSLVATTALAKEGTTVRWARGRLYLDDFARPYWLWIPAIILVAGGYLPLCVALAQKHATRALAVVGAFVTAGFLVGAYVVMVGGDYMHGRLFLPAYFALCAPVAMIPVARRYVAGLAVLPWLAVAGLALRPPQLRGNPLANVIVAPVTTRGLVTTDDLGWDAGGPARAWYREPGYYYLSEAAGGMTSSDLELAPGVRVPVVSTSAIGVLGYALGPSVHIYDTLGLADPLAARLDTDRATTVFFRPVGHEKPIPPAWSAARLIAADAAPSATDVTQGLTPLIPTAEGAAFDDQVRAARRALDCPDLADLRAAVGAPLTPGRFLSNFFGSFERTRLRIAPDPLEAVEDLC